MACGPTIQVNIFGCRTNVLKCILNNFSRRHPILSIFQLCEKDTIGLTVVFKNISHNCLKVGLGTVKYFLVDYTVYTCFTMYDSLSLNILVRNYSLIVFLSYYYYSLCGLYLLSRVHFAGVNEKSAGVNVI